MLDNTQNEFQSYNGGDMTCYGHLLIDVKDKVTKKYHPIRFYVMNTDVPRILISHAASYWLGLVKVLCDNKEFQSYNGGDMTCYGHLLIDVKDKVTKKYHPIRFYVMNTDVPRILISHAASYWLGLVKVLCDNKAPRIKRQVASIDKKSNFRAKSSHFRTSTQNTASSSQKKQMTLKMVTSGKVHVPSPRMQNFEDAKIQGGKRATGVRPGRDVDVSDGEQHSQEEPSATTGKEPKTSESGNSVHSGPNKKITDSVKDGPFSNAKSGPKMKHTSKKGTT